LPSGAWNHRIVCAPFEGQVFSSLRLGPFEGFAYVIRSQAVLMPPVAAAVMRRGRAFSGGTTARRAGDVGVDMMGRRGPSVVTL
jgi:hypothetical protein